MCIKPLVSHVLLLKIKVEEKENWFKEKYFLNKFRYSAMWQESGWWYPQGWETMDWTWAWGSTLSAPVSTQSKVGVGYHMEGSYSASGACPAGLFDFHDDPARQHWSPHRTVGEKQRGQQSSTVTPLLIPCAWSGSPGLKMWLDWFSDTQERASWQWISPFYPAEWESIVTLRRYSAKSLTLLYWEIGKHFI